MSELTAALTARKKLAKLVKKLTGIESLGIDVGTRGDYGVRVMIEGNAPKETEDTIPDNVDGVRIVRRRTGGGSIRFE